MIVIWLLGLVLRRLTGRGRRWFLGLGGVRGGSGGLLVVLLRCLLLLGLLLGVLLGPGRVGLVRLALERELEQGLGLGPAVERALRLEWVPRLFLRLRLCLEALEFLGARSRQT